MTALRESGTPQQSIISPAIILGRLALCAGLLLLTWFAVRGYLSQYYFVAAKRGEKSLTEYERLLRLSLQNNPTNGRTGMELASLLASQKQFEAAKQLQAMSMKTYRTLSTFEQAGSVQEKLAESTTGEPRRQLIDSARQLYEKAERISPGNVSALEHLMVLAYKNQDDDALEDYSARLGHAQALNINGIYLRALAAERKHDTVTAIGLYQRVAAVTEPPAGSIFTTSTVAQRLRQLTAGTSSTP
jgi:tetratricopeptide (TPR) repeat protein